MLSFIFSLPISVCMYKANKGVVVVVYNIMLCSKPVLHKKYSIHQAHIHWQS